MFESFIDSLKKSLTKPLPGEASQYKMAPEGRKNIPLNEKSNNAAVLLLLFPNFNQPYIVFTKRHDYNGPHGGQVSFPGGKQELHDANLEQTAIREASEELGVPAYDIQIIGQLSSLTIPVSGFTVYPFVGFLNKKPIWEPNSFEVNYILEIPVAQLINPNSIMWEYWILHNSQVKVPFYNVANEKIWGATAMILSEFTDVV
jgi:8-oxo-dGTP pyrophosphatase MutT (NUDIX family)